ncbi:hypothetical protein HPB52_003234 [Rhipicephalus sanguineus]|uniref:Uncharacterized protein n=1 Tax=Rhipicephalus sanguineus TaxID=34632 RepID=A0A9D4SVH6_RHISA|nr:hypothetical protein HPB52_003234 [Rhipicephalus sanguineus]
MEGRGKSRSRRLDRESRRVHHYQRHTLHPRRTIPDRSGGVRVAILRRRHSDGGRLRSLSLHRRSALQFNRALLVFVAFDLSLKMDTHALVDALVKPFATQSASCLLRHNVNQFAAANVPELQLACLGGALGGAAGPPCSVLAGAERGLFPVAAEAAPCGPDPRPLPSRACRHACSAVLGMRCVNGGASREGAGKPVTACFLLAAWQVPWGVSQNDLEAVEDILSATSLARGRPLAPGPRRLRGLLLLAAFGSAPSSQGGPPRVASVGASPRRLAASRGPLNGGGGGGTPRRLLAAGLASPERREVSLDERV